jgi:hypothetical protein
VILLPGCGFCTILAVFPPAPQRFHVSRLTGTSLAALRDLVAGRNLSHAADQDDRPVPPDGPVEVMARVVVQRLSTSLARISGIRSPWGICWPALEREEMRPLSEFPWTKQEIIDTVKTRYRPVDSNDFTTHGYAAIFAAFGVLALGRPEGRAAPHQEDALFRRVARIWAAMRDGRDPEVAYDVPVFGEEPLTPEVQLSRPYRDVQQLLNKLEGELRERRRE